MYLTNFDEFCEAAEKLFMANPTKFRYLFKYHHKNGKVVLKVTDNKVVFKYRTDQLSDVKRIEKLHGLMLKAMTTAQEPAQDK